MGYFVIPAVLILAVSTFSITEWLLQYLPHPLEWILAEDRLVLGSSTLAGLDFEYGLHVLAAGAIYIVMPLILVTTLVLLVLSKEKA